jgi:CheY-like chemotaxis protein
MMSTIPGRRLSDVARASLKKRCKSSHPRGALTRASWMLRWDFRGWQLNDPDLRDIPVILVTAAGFSRNSLRTQLGAIEVVAKPFLPSEILTAIKIVRRSTRL